MLEQEIPYASIPRTLDQQYADGILPSETDPGMRIMRGAIEGIIVVGIFRAMSGGAVLAAETLGTGLTVGIGVSLLDIMVPSWSGAGRIGAAMAQYRP